MNEFEIINRFFKTATKRSDVILGIGDDAAIVAPESLQQLAITTDSLVENIHFKKNQPAYDIGYQALAVNLSDLAAMGAKPAWFMLALTMPFVDENWLKEFTQGLFDLAKPFKMELIGGNLSRGPLNICIQATGYVSPNQAITRNSAKAGDFIFVTNTLGNAAFALKNSTPHKIFPQIEIGVQLRKIATAAIDISDGLITDLNHILEQSHVGAVINVNQIPLNKMLKSLSFDEAMQYALSGGGDYELCFTVPKEKIDFLKNIACTKIGKTTTKKDLILQKANGNTYVFHQTGYQHF